MEWDKLKLHQKIAAEGPRLQRAYPDYLNKIKAKEIVKVTIPTIKVAKLVRVLHNAKEFNAEDLNPLHILKASRGSDLCLDLATVKSSAIVRTKMTEWKVALDKIKQPYEYLIEEKICDAVKGVTGAAIDYKFFCFNGKPKLFLTRVGTGPRNFYYLDYTPLKLDGSKQIPKIDLTEMINIAEKLSAQFPFVRIDLYNGVDGIYFGEYTFHVREGRQEFSNELELELGKLWTTPPP